MTTIAIIGATGYTGRNIMDEALSRGYDVIAVARDTSSLKPSEHLQLRTGSIYDNDFIDKLAADSDVIILAVPARPIDGHSASEAISDISEIAAKHQTRLGVMGGAGSLHVSPGGPRLFETPDFPEEFKPEVLGSFDILMALERTLDHVDWFYVSPSAAYGAQVDPPARGTYKLGGSVLLSEPDGTSTIAGRDLAKAFVDEIASPTHFRERFTVGY
jgi:putative NADH-flavin reductase